MTRRLDHDPFIEEVRAQALANEFTWDEWTHLRHAYLRARHHWRFHPDHFVIRAGRLPESIEGLAAAIRDVVDGRIGPLSAVTSALPALSDIHALLAEDVAAWLVHLLGQPVEWVVDAWESGTLPLLVLRLLEAEIDTRMSSEASDRVDRPFTDEATSYGAETWRQVGSLDVEVEGHLEDVAYHRLAHDKDIAVTLESADASICYFAASCGLVIGEHPYVRPRQGEKVRLRTWTRDRTQTVEGRPGQIDQIEETVAESFLEANPDSDALVRIVLLVDGGEVAPITWAVWTNSSLRSWVGWVLLEDEREYHRLYEDFDDGGE